jgi:hypothetical protein
VKKLPDIKKRMLANSEVRSAYDALADEFDLSRELIAARPRAGSGEAPILSPLRHQESFPLPFNTLPPKALSQCGERVWVRGILASQFPAGRPSSLLRLRQLSSSGLTFSVTTQPIALKFSLASGDSCPVTQILR